jgi:hypothetical protein
MRIKTFAYEMAELNGRSIDCSAFTPVREIAELMRTEVGGDGLRHVLEFHGQDGAVYEGPSPRMIQTNAIGFLQRENGIADAKRRGYRWKKG